MYTRYFGLIDPPFSIAPNPRYLYMSDRHREALAHLLYGVRSDGGFVLLTGEVGTGKTTVCRCLLEELPSEVDTAFILNPRLTATELLATICDDLDIEYPAGATLKTLVDGLNTYLLRSHSANRRTLLIIDEAQNLSIDVLEQLRLLTNLETNQRKLLQIILLGQPELLGMLDSPELRQLSQRITARFHLDALRREEVAEYIRHRLAVAGAKGELFPEALCRRIYRLSGGIPRLINLICDRALLGTYAQNRLSVDAETVDKAAREVFGTPSRQHTRLTAATAFLLLLVTLSAAGWMLVQGQKNDTALAARASAPASAREVPVERPPSGESASTAPAGAPAISSAPPESGMATAPVAAPIALLDAATPDEAMSATQTATESAALDAEALRELLETAPAQDVEAAYSTLFRLWGFTYAPDPALTPCDSAQSVGLRCWHRLASLREIEHLNRPAILELGSGDEPVAYATLVAYGDGAVTLDIEGKEYTVDDRALTGLWNGRHTVLWRTPPGYVAPGKLDDTGETVAWLEEHLATIHSRLPRNARGLRFDRQIEQDVIRFQMEEGLVPDGVAGAQTWIHLNSRSEPVPLLRAASTAADR